MIQPVMRQLRPIDSRPDRVGGTQTVADVPAKVEKPTANKSAGKGRRKRREEDCRFTGDAGINLFIDSEESANLPLAAQFVWAVLWRDSRKAVAETSQGHVAKRMGVDERTVRRAIAALTAAGYLEVLQKGRKSGRASRYRLYATPRIDVAKND